MPESVVQNETHHADTAAEKAPFSSQSLVEAQDLARMRNWTIQLIQTGRALAHIQGEEYPVYLPSGSRQYPAFWTRDAVWIVQSELVSVDEIESMVRVLALTQNGSAVQQLEHGLIVPAWAITDHVLLDGGGAIWFPGTYRAGSDQGDGLFGFKAAQDACYQFIEMCYLWCRQAASIAPLLTPIDGVSLLDRMKFAFNSPDADATTQLAMTTEETRAVAFSDGIVKTGFLLEGSILRWRAALRLSALSQRLDNASDARHYAQIARQIEQMFVPTFWHETIPDRQGWLYSATQIGRQDCVRGTCFALAWGLLRGTEAQMAGAALAAASTAARLNAIPGRGQITFQGHVRHLRNGEYWQQTSRMAQESYQNGGYWSMFVGQYVRALEKADPALARVSARLFLDHLRRHNFYDGASTERGAPWEWIHPDGRRVGPLYLAGLTLSYRGFTSPFTDFDVFPSTACRKRR